jgi:aspartyl/asparaginyl-tRNA synthetase
VIKLLHSKKGFDYIILIVDHLHKHDYFLLAMEQGPIVEAFPKTFVEFYMRLHGVLDIIVSDQDSHFIGKFWSTLLAMFQV